MHEEGSNQKVGEVASLHIHPPEPGEPMRSVKKVRAVRGKGIAEDGRYYERLSRHTTKPTRRQVSLMEREEISEQAATLDLERIDPGQVRSNLETSGVNLMDFIGQHIRIGDAVLHIYEPRKPCAKMDEICPGLRDLMENDRQGVMAEVVQSGTIQVGDAIASNL